MVSGGDGARGFCSFFVTVVFFLSFSFVVVSFPFLFLWAVVVVSLWMNALYCSCVYLYSCYFGCVVHHK